MAWTNDDGLKLKYGVEKTTPQIGGEYVTFGPERMVEFKLTLKNLTEAETVQSDTIFIPKGVRINKVEVITNETAATGVAVDVGVVKQDRSTELDYQGFLKAFPLASMSAAGETITLTPDNGATGIGDLIGTTTADSGYITASRTTSTAFTTGVIYVRVSFNVPV